MRPTQLLRWTAPAMRRRIRANRRLAGQLELRNARLETDRWRRRAEFFLECEVDRIPADKKLCVTWSIDTSVLRVQGAARATEAAAAYLFRKLEQVRL